MIAPDAARWPLIASLFFGISYLLVRDLGWPDAVTIAWKGAGVGLLAVFAALSASKADGWLIAGVLGLGALGDVLLEIDLVTGAIAFTAGHAVAIVLYLRNRRARLSVSQRALVLLVVPVAVLVSWSLPADRGMAGGVAFYALMVAAMAACAWASRFPRYRTGIGAMLFLVSDLFIFARMGPLAGSALPGLAVWPLYYLGQLLICLGVTGTLARDSAAGTLTK